ncbi:MAG TPA: hypothetical protein VMZ66_09605 [Aeromicrobium sp.]|nr:hypothetical protein [Aeromicrobium sp.]
MRAAYLWLARLIAVLVVVQAMTIVFAVSGLFNWITEKGGSLDASVVKSWDDTPPTFTGAIGHLLHVEVGEKLMPALALLLLIVAFFAKVSQGVAIALVLLVLVILQILAGMNADNMPYLGLWHGLNAFLIFGAAMAAAMKAKEVRPVPAA